MHVVVWLVYLSFDYLFLFLLSFVRPRSLIRCTKVEHLTFSFHLRASVCYRSFIMEEHWSSSNDKLVSAEEGLLKPEIRKKNMKAEKSYCCEKLIQIVKFILYFLLICFVAWSGYTCWQEYKRNENIHFYIFNSGSNSSSEGESSIVSNESPSLSLNNVEETLETMTTTTNIPFERVLFSNRILSNDNQFVTTTEILDSSSDKDDIITMNPEEKVITNPFENTSTYKPLKDSSELQIDDYKNQMKDTTSSLELMENKDKEDHAVFEWYIPLFSTIYMDSILSIDNSSKETRNSEMDEFVKEFFRNVEEQNELYSSSISDEITESSRMDVKSDYWNPQATWDILEDWKQDSTEASIFISEEISEEKYKSSFSHDSLIKKEEEEEEKEDMHKYFKRNHGQGDIDLIPSFAKDEDSGKSDTSKVEDDNMNEWKSGLFSTSDWRMPDSSIERSNTEEEEESTEKNISTEMSVTSDEQQIEKVVNILKLWGIIDRDDDVDSSVYSSTENVDSEKKIESEQRQEQNRCIKVIINGIEIMKCYFIPFQSTKEDLLGSLNYNSNEMKSPDEYVDNSYTIPYPDTIKESMDFPNFQSKKQDYEMKSPDEYVDNSYNIPYPDTIKESMDSPNFESKKQDFSTEWKPKMDPITDAYPEENSYQDVEDPIRLWLDLSRYNEK